MLVEWDPNVGFLVPSQEKHCGGEFDEKLPIFPVLFLMGSLFFHCHHHDGLEMGTHTYEAGEVQIGKCFEMATRRKSKANWSGKQFGCGNMHLMH